MAFDFGSGAPMPPRQPSNTPPDYSNSPNNQPPSAPSGFQNAPTVNPNATAGRQTGVSDGYDNGGRQRQRGRSIRQPKVTRRRSVYIPWHIIIMILLILAVAIAIYVYRGVIYAFIAELLKLFLYLGLIAFGIVFMFKKIIKG